MFRLILVLLLIDPPKFQKIEIRKICERKKSFLDLYKQKVHRLTVCGLTSIKSSMAWALLFSNSCTAHKDNTVQYLINCMPASSDYFALMEYLSFFHSELSSLGFSIMREPW